MNWKFTDPAMMRQTSILSPSMRAVGPNVYLRQIDFGKMLLLAIVAHLGVMAFASMLPEQKITSIPVHSLSFKIGENQRIAAFVPPKPAAPKMIASAPAPAKPAPKPTPKPTPVKAAPKPTPAPAPANAWRTATTEKSVIKTAPKAAVETVEAKPLPAPVPLSVKPIAPPSQRQMPQENQAEIKKESSLLDYLMLPINAIVPQNNKPAIADTPQQYVREHGGAPIDTLRQQAHNAFGKGDAATTVGGEASGGTGMTAEQEIRANYEQTISGWIQQHKIYPASARGREGRAVLRIRIDRQGYVRYYALEESSGVAVLNSSAIDMVRRANPVPAVPENYPAGNLIEFLIPITFEAP